MRLRYGFVVHAGKRFCPDCDVVVTMNNQGHHALACGSFGSFVVRHNRVRDLVADGSKKIGARVSIEWLADEDGSKKRQEM